jgi:hypothetical protein
VISVAPTLQERLRAIGVTWSYWLIPTLFGAAAVAAFAAIHVEPESTLTLIGCGALFSVISLLSFLWPLIRVREHQNVRFAVLQFRDNRLEGVLIPASRVKPTILLLGSGVFGFAGLIALIFAQELENRIKGGIAFTAYMVIALLMLRGGAGRQPGILLGESGLFIRDTFDAFQVPWDALMNVEVYTHQEKYNTTQSLGFKLNHVELESVPKRIRNKLLQNAQRFGWHFYLHAETLLAPLEDIRDTIRIYLENPPMRGELSSGSAVARIEARFKHGSALNSV